VVRRHAGAARHGLHARAGHITAILGANGAGKTTTLRALCQIVRTTGSIAARRPVTCTGRQVTEAVVRLGVAHVPDGRGTFTALSVEENLRLGAHVRSDKAADAARTWSACSALSAA
jgi:branched-chain amino acid transport system ATP-binding protein